VDVQRPFAQEMADVAVFERMIPRYDVVAAAERAQALAKRNVEVHGPFRIPRHRPPEMLEPGLRAQVLLPRRHGRITGIARNRDVVFGEKFLIHANASRTRSTKRRTLSSGVSGKTP